MCSRQRKGRNIPVGRNTSRQLPFRVRRAKFWFLQPRSLHSSDTKNDYRVRRIQKTTSKRNQFTPGVELLNASFIYTYYPPNLDTYCVLPSLSQTYQRHPVFSPILQMVGDSCLLSSPASSITSLTRAAPTLEPNQLRTDYMCEVWSWTEQFNATAQVKIQHNGTLGLKW